MIGIECLDKGNLHTILLTLAVCQSLKIAKDIDEVKQQLRGGHELVRECLLCNEVCWS